MKNKCYTLLVIAALLITNEKVFATHMAGADLTYQHIGANQYLINYTFYRDCIGISAQASIDLVYSSASCNVSLSTILNPVPGTGQLISFVCPGALTTCDGGTAPGIQKWEYTGIITLPASCSDWVFGVSECCRNAAITTIVDAVNDNMYLEAYLNNLVSENSSPIFANVPIAFECIGQDNFYNHGGFDADGDSLVYSFAIPLDGPNQSLVYMPGYSIAAPITSVPSVYINSFTGDIFMHPVAQEVGVMAVRIEEYRNGVLIGSVVRDIQIYSVNCNNNLPLASGIDSTTSYNLTRCVGDPICFDIFTFDPDSSDTLSVLWNHGIPAASFNVDSSRAFPKIHFCWSPTAAEVRTQPYYFTVTVHDNACPSNGVQSFAYSITLRNLDARVSSTDVTCAGGHNGTASVSPLVNQPYQYFWMPGQSTTASINHLTAGNYTVNILDTNGCMGIYFATINEPPPLNVAVTGQDATCSGQTSSANALASGGTGNYSYLWSTTPPQTTPTITDIDAGNYSVVVTDANNCTTSGTVSISSTSPFLATITSTPATCNANDGSASVNVAGGSGNFSFNWQPNVSSGPDAEDLPAGVYAVTVTDDSSGCIQYLSTIINSSIGITATITSVTDATCETGEDGSAIVVASGGNDPYTYLWMPGNSTNDTASNLSPGTYTVRVADYDGCPAYTNVTIGFDYPAPLLELGADTILCTGDILVLDAGSNHLTYLWSDNTSNQTLTVTAAGMYSVLVTDSNGCENFDAINVNYMTCISRNHYYLDRQPTIDVYPNPTNNVIHIHAINLSNQQTTVRIYNSIGTLLWKMLENVNGTYFRKIDISSYVPGAYIVEVMNGNTFMYTRVIKL